MMRGRAGLVARRAAAVLLLMLIGAATTAVAQRPVTPTRPAPARPAARPAPRPDAPPRAPTVSQLSPGLVLLPLGDTVLVYLDSTPRPGEGWRVWRDETLLTETPATPVEDPAALPGLLGADWPMAQRAVELESPVMVLRRLRLNGPTATLLVARSRAVASAVGRLVVDPRAPVGRTATYRAELVPLNGGDAPPRRTLRGSVLVATPVPPVPAGLVATARPEGVQLSWTLADGPAAATVVGFVVERADSGESWRSVTPQVLLRLVEPRQRWVDAAAPVGVSLQYRVRTVDLADRPGTPSAPVLVRVTDRSGPLPPLEAATESLDGAIRVVWRQSLEPDVAGYVIERARGSDTVFTRLTRAPVAGGSWTDSTVRGLAPHAYRIRAVDKAGNVGVAGTAVVGSATDRRPPAAPSGLEAALRPGRRVQLRWTPSPSPDVLGYVIRRADGGGTPVRMLTSPVVGRSSEDRALADGLVPGKRYEFQVVAVDSALNESPAIAVPLLVPDDVLPDTVRALRLASDRGRAVMLSWTASGSGDIARYDILRSGPDTVARVVGTRRPLDDLEFRDTTAVRGTRYRYRLVAVDSAGNRSRAVSDTLTLREVEIPAAVGRLVAMRRGATTVLEWERSGSRDLRGYHVYRSERPNGTFVQITDLPVTVPTFTDARGPAGAFYLIRAVDRAGNLSLPSAAVQGAVP